ncbi:uncharacterized protein LOC111047869 [Nilaparvata lugens]|uniref:uncharacterized protein LOC111047869 n=1 Tax=Nilaparvata lugens TaxID=108931 RepID=UPI00193EB102|nr:uncharacterized protein LOC111047869 [Nilaparvata lugens]
MASDSNVDNVNSSDPNIVDDDDDEDDDDLLHLQLKERIREAEELSRQLQLRNKSMDDLKFVSNANVDVSQNLFVGNHEIVEMEIQGEPVKGISNRKVTEDSQSQNEPKKKLLSKKIKKTGKKKSKKTGLRRKSDISEQFKRKKSTENIALKSNTNSSCCLSSKNPVEEQILPEKLKAVKDLEIRSKLSMLFNLTSNGKVGLQQSKDNKLIHQKITRSVSAVMIDKLSLKNISNRIDSNINLEIESRDFMDENILKMKIRNAEKYRRELDEPKLANATALSLLSISGRLNLDLLKSKKKVKKKIHELLGDKSEVIDSHSKQMALDSLNKAESENLYKQDLLSKYKKCVENLLNKNQNLQKSIFKRILLKDKMMYKHWKSHSAFVFGLPYFKEGYDTCPPNADTRLRIKRHQPIITHSEIIIWSPKNKSDLISNVREILRDKIIDKLSSGIHGIASSKKKVDASNKIKKVKAMSLKELMLQESISLDDDVDWKIISINLFSELRSPAECQGLFQMCLNPTKNNGKWSKEEKQKLSVVAEKHYFEDWDEIATELGTNRSAYNCCKVYQKGNLSKTGKWTKEEDSKLIEAVKKFRVGDEISWMKVALVFKRRSMWQLKTRWLQALAPHRKKGKFSVLEDKLIFKAVEMHGCEFKKVATHFPNRTHSQLKGRYQRKMENQYIKGYWSLEEDRLLMRLVEEIGVKKWKEISERFTTRTRTQVRQRYNKIKSFLDESPTHKLEDMIRIGFNHKKATSRSETVVSDANSPVAECPNQEKITDEVDAPGNRIRKPVVSINSGDNNRPMSKRVKKSVDTSQEPSRFENLMRLMNQKRNQKTATGKKLIKHFQDTYPMQALVGKKTWDEKDIVSDAQCILDLSHILKVDFSYIDDLSRQRAVSPFMLRQIVKCLIENHSHKLLRLNPVISNHDSKDASHDSNAALSSRDAPSSSRDAPLDSIAALSSRDALSSSRDAPLDSSDASLDSNNPPSSSRDTPVDSNAALSSRDAPSSSRDAPLDSIAALSSRDAPSSSRDAPLDSSDVSLDSNNHPSSSRDSPVDSNAALISRDAPLDFRDTPLDSNITTLDCDVAWESDSNISLCSIDCAPLPVEETLCSEALFEYWFDEDYSSSNKVTEKVDIQVEKQQEIIRNNKKRFLKYPYLLPPNLATAVGYRSILLLERRLKDKGDTKADDDDDDNYNPDDDVQPDYSPGIFRPKNEEKQNASKKQLDMKECIRFTKEEAMHMFQERLHVLFAGPIVMSETADRYFSITNLPMYEGSPPVTERRQRHLNTQASQNSKWTALAIKFAEEIRTIVGELSTETLFSTPGLNIEHINHSSSKLLDCRKPSTSKLFEDCELRSTTTSTSSFSKSNSYLVKEQDLLERNCSRTVNNSAPQHQSLDFCIPSTSNRLSENVNSYGNPRTPPSTLPILDCDENWEPSSSKSFDCRQRSTSKHFDNRELNERTSETDNVRDYCNLSSSSSISTKANVCIDKEQNSPKRKCPVKVKISTPKTIDLCVPNTKKRPINNSNCNSSSSTSSVSESNLPFEQNPAKRKCLVNVENSTQKTLNLCEPSTSNGQTGTSKNVKCKLSTSSTLASSEASCVRKKYPKRRQTKRRK